ncbi:protein toll-like [Mytilus trossulus]|uniref:protein toll-like n=1 Tax=Mytilus trossulus TaxID=6551 RepID=UPI0030073519
MRTVIIVCFVFTVYLIYHGHSQENSTDDLLGQDSMIEFSKQDFVNENETVGNNGNSILPESLNETCTITETIGTYYCYCLIDKKHSGLWDFAAIRKWIVNSNYEFQFDLKCVNFSKIALPWPIKAKNIDFVRVKSCTITGFFTDYGNPYIETISDHLRVMDISNSIVLMLLKTVNQKNSEDEIIDAGSNMIANIRELDHRCSYNELIGIDISSSTTRSRYFLSILIELSTFPKVTFFNLSNTGQTEITKEFKMWWRFFPKMELLDLSYNIISTIDLDPSAFTWSSFKIKIDLRYNNITELAQEDLELLGSLSNVNVDIRYNPIHCECSDHMIELLEIIHDDTKWEAMGLHRYDYLKNMTCNLPDILKGRKLSDITKSDILCPMFSASSPALIIVLSICILILIVIIILLTKFRKEIFILTYTRFHIILPCQPAEVSENKTYDAFVSYSSQDEEWVSKTFNELEVSSQSDGYHQFRFCLHHRDFVPGKTIFDNVIDSVESSRHTVIILSKHFLQSHYCMYEFHEAFQQSIIERKRHMVVVLMENIPEGELPTDLKRCLKTFTYIRRDDSIFKDRLIFAMSHKGRGKAKSNNKNTVTDGLDNPVFSSSEKDVTLRLETSRPRHDDSVITLSQIVPDLVVGHNESKSNGNTLA